MTPSLRQLPLLSKILIAGGGVLKIAENASMPFLAIYLARHAHLEPWLVGLILASTPLAGLFAGFFAGQLSDRIGRAPLILGAAFGMAGVAGGFFASAALPQGGTQLTVLVLLNIGYGLLSRILGTLNQAVLGDLVDPSNRATAYHWRYTVINIGASIGPMVGAYLGLSSSTGAFAFTGVAYAAYGLFFLTIFKRVGAASPHASGRRPALRESFETLLSDRKLRYFIAAGILFNTCYSQIDSTISQHLTAGFENGLLIFSQLLTLNCVTVVVLQTFSYPIIQRLGLSRSLFTGGLLLSFGFLLFALSGQSVEMLYAGMLVLTAGEVLVFSPSGAFIDQLAPEHLRGAYFGAANFKQLGSSLGPAMGGFLLQSLGGSGLFLTVSLIAIGSAILQLAGEQIPFREKRVAA